MAATRIPQETKNVGQQPHIENASRAPTTRDNATKLDPSPGAVKPRRAGSLAGDQSREARILPHAVAGGLVPQVRGGGP
jgi:hypothetical protein